MHRAGEARGAILSTGFSGTVLHIGVGTGEDLSEYLSSAAAKIILVEPDSEHRRGLRQHAGGDVRVRIRAEAIGSGNSISLRRYSPWNVLTGADLGGHAHHLPGLKLVELVEVVCKPLQDLLLEELQTDERTLVIETPGTEVSLIEQVASEVGESYFAEVVVAVDRKLQQLHISDSESDIRTALFAAGYVLKAVSAVEHRVVYRAEPDPRRFEIAQEVHELQAALDESRRLLRETDNRRLELAAELRELKSYRVSDTPARETEVTPPEEEKASAHRSLRRLVTEKQGKVVDKWEFYLDYYDSLLAQTGLKPKTMLEIGVQNGGSLEVWAHAFPGLDSLIGVDVDERCRTLEYTDPRIEVVIGPAESPHIARQVLSRVPAFDLVVDDGSHAAEHVIANFVQYFSSVNPYGIYVVEDAHTSYWPEYGGGLEESASHMSFFKALGDLANHEHWAAEATIREHLLPHLPDSVDLPLTFTEELLLVHEIRFANSLIVVRKGAGKSSLGRRVIRGDEAAVNPPSTGGGRVDGAQVGHMRTSGSEGESSQE